MNDERERGLERPEEPARQSQWPDWPDLSNMDDWLVQWERWDQSQPLHPEEPDMPEPPGPPEELEKPEQQEPAADEKKRGLGYELYMLLHDLVYILTAVTVIFVFAIRLVGVSGDSMYPTLHNRDFLGLLSNVLYREVKAGDVVVMTVPYYENEPIVKRVIATEGQTVDIDFLEGVVYVDGEALDEPYVNEPTYTSFLEIGQALEYPLEVEEGHIFVLGDNRNQSADSRYAPVGLVDERDVLGKVLFLLLPGKDAENQYPDCRVRDFGRIGGIS